MKGSADIFRRTEPLAARLAPKRLTADNGCDANSLRRTLEASADRKRPIPYNCQTYRQGNMIEPPLPPQGLPAHRNPLAPERVAQ